MAVVAERYCFVDAQSVLLATFLKRKFFVTFNGVDVCKNKKNGITLNALVIGEIMLAMMFAANFTLIDVWLRGVPQFL